MFICTPPGEPADSTNTNVSGIGTTKPITIKNVETGYGYSVTNASVVYNNAKKYKIGTYEITTNGTVTITYTYIDDSTLTITQEVNGTYRFKINKYVKGVNIAVN